MTLINLGNGLIASGAGDKTIKIWDINNQKCIATLMGNESIYTLICKVP